MFSFKTAFFSMALLFILALPIANHVTHAVYFEKMQKEAVQDFKNYYPQILADLKLIDQNPVFNKFTFEKNAEAAFSKHLSWSGDNTKDMNDLNHSNLNAFFEKYPNSWTDSQVLVKMTQDPDIHKIDTTWMNDLHQYDHWNISTNSYITEELKRVKSTDTVARIGLWAALPIPNYSELRKWTLVHFLKQHKKMNTVEGLKLYRKMAELTYTNSSLIASMISVRFLKDEAELARIFSMDNWVQIDEERTEALKRLSWAWVGITQNSLYQVTPYEINDFFKYENGVCAAAWEIIPNSSFLTDLIGPRFLIETDHTVELARLQKMTDRLVDTCGLQAYRVFDSRAPASTNGVLGENVKSFVLGADPTSQIKYVPYMRRIIAYILTSVATPSYFRLYDKKIASAQK